MANTKQVDILFKTLIRYIHDIAMAWKLLPVACLPLLNISHVDAGKYDHLIISPLPKGKNLCLRCNEFSIDTYSLDCNSQHVFCEDCLQPFRQTENQTAISNDAITLADDISLLVHCPECSIKQDLPPAPTRARLLKWIQSHQVHCNHCQSSGKFSEHHGCMKRKSTREITKRSYSPPGAAAQTAHLHSPALASGYINETPDTGDAEWVIPLNGADFACFEWQGLIKGYPVALSLNYDLFKNPVLTWQFHPGIKESGRVRITAALQSRTNKSLNGTPLNSFKPIDPSESVPYGAKLSNHFQWDKMNCSSSEPGVLFNIIPVDDEIITNPDNSITWTITPDPLLTIAAATGNSVLSQPFSIKPYFNPETSPSSIDAFMNFVLGPVRESGGYPDDIEIGIAISTKSDSNLNNLNFFSESIFNIHTVLPDDRQEKVHECSIKDFRNAGVYYRLCTTKLTKTITRLLSDNQKLKFILTVKPRDMVYRIRKAALKFLDFSKFVIAPDK